MIYLGLLLKKGDSYATIGENAKLTCGIRKMRISFVEHSWILPVVLQNSFQIPML